MVVARVVSELCGKLDGVLAMFKAEISTRSRVMSLTSLEFAIYVADVLVEVQFGCVEFAVSTDDQTSKGGMFECQAGGVE